MGCTQSCNTCFFEERTGLDYPCNSCHPSNSRWAPKESPVCSGRYPWATLDEMHDCHVKGGVIQTPLMNLSEEEKNLRNKAISRFWDSLPDSFHGIISLSDSEVRCLIRSERMRKDLNRYLKTVCMNHIPSCDNLEVDIKFDTKAFEESIKMAVDRFESIQKDNGNCIKLERKEQKTSFASDSERSVLIASSDAKHLITDAFRYLRFGSASQADSKLKIEWARIAHAPIEVLDSDSLGTRLFANGKLVCGLNREVTAQYLSMMGKRLNPVNLPGDRHV